MFKRILMTTVFVTALAAAGARAEDTPGVTKDEIKIGNTEAYSGPASAYGVIGKTESAFFKMINDEGGINGRKVNFISLDDGYSPPKTVEVVRQMLEQDGVAFFFNGLGTPPNTAIQKYLNARKVPQLFVATGADKWGNYKDFPWTIGFQPSYRVEARIYARYILKEKPDAKVAILYANDDFGKDYVAGMKDILGDKYKQMVTEASYETTDASIDSQIVSLQGSGADVLLIAATPKFAAQSIRKVYDIGWKPSIELLTNVSLSVGAVIKPAGVEKAVGIITSAYGKDPTDPEWKDDPGLNQWRAFMAKYMPGSDLSDANFVYGYGVSLLMVQVLKQCGNDLSRENIMRQATNVKNLDGPTLLPGIRMNTSPTNYHPITQMQLQKWNGTTWVRFGEIINGDGGS
jgi:branched-chain amino acid transport system substrate-binding protein